MPPCPIPDRLRDTPSPAVSASSDTPSPSPEDEAPPHFDPLPEQSRRTALILDRFSVNCNVLYCSNDSLISTMRVMGRSFYDFVASRDEDTVRAWIDVIKGWGVNERGQPSDGGFGFGKFTLCVQGRDSRFVVLILRSTTVCWVRKLTMFNSARQTETAPSRHRYDKPVGGREASARDRDRDREHGRTHRASISSSHTRGRDRRGSADYVVDAIFSAHSDGLMVILRKSNSR